MRRTIVAVLSVAFWTGAALAAPPSIPAAERTALLKAAGFQMRGAKPFNACEMEAAPAIEMRDLNGDARPEAIVTDSGGCYGGDGAWFNMLTKTPKGAWTSLLSFTGMPTILKTRNQGWPDVEIGGMGFCFPVWRWNGREYAIHKKCPPR